MLDLKGLNENQLKAVTVSNGPVVVVAGAGSGKTRVLSTRIAYLIEHEHYDPWSILAITFTNKAANEMKYRITNNIGIKNISWIGTYHSVCLRILKEDIECLNRKNNFNVIDEEDQMSLIKEIYRVNQITRNVCSTIKPKKAIQLIEAIKFQDVNINDFNIGTNFLKSFKMYTLDEYKAMRIIFNDYQKKLLLNNLLDFNDLLILTKKLLESNSMLKTKWQKRFRYILVDEFQDTNEIQFNILKMLINPKHKNIFVVGDPDQSIYKWRGAYEWIFKDFREQFPEAKLVILDTNYRSTKNILNGSNKLISNNPNRIKKDLATNNEVGEKIFYFHADDQMNESLFIAKKIIELTKEKYKYSDIAILYRSNYLSRIFEEQLMTNNIPYYIFGGIKFYQRKEIKDLLAYLRLMISEDEISIKRIINIPGRKIGDTTINKMQDFATKNNLSLFDTLKFADQDWNWKSTNEFHKLIFNLRNLIKDLSPSKALEKIIDVIDYKSYLKSLDLEDRIENINELINAIKVFEQRNETATIASFLQEISLYTDTSEHTNKNTNSVSLMTIHVAKGTEYRVVFLAGFTNNIFPPSRSTDYEEERRIAYVGMTRAKELLYITCSDGISYASGNYSSLGPSMFLKEIGTNNLEEVQQEFIPISKADLNWYNSKAKIENYDDRYETKNVIFNIGDVVSHTIFGSGVIIGIDKDILTIAFKAPYGVKELLKNHKNIKRVKN